MPLIVGVLQFQSKFKFERTKNGLELFLFKPLWKKLPSMLVASKKHDRNHYALVESTDLTGHSGPPRGILNRLLGECHIIENVYDAIIYKHDLTTVKPKFNRKPLAIAAARDQHLPYDRYVFSVDPPGCQDIDDALSISENNTVCEVGIHIADVSYFYEKCGITLNNWSTIYAPHRNYDMIPSSFSTDACSLREGKDRFCVSLFISMDETTANVRSYRLERNVIRSRKAYSYDELQRVLDTVDKDAPERRLYDLARKLSGGLTAFDTHIMVEQFMVLANTLVGQHIRKTQPRSAQLFRVHAKQLTVQPVPESLRDVVQICQSQAALYVSGESASFSHDGLERQFYTHFTSPIRRFPDLYVHQLCFPSSEKKTLAPFDCDRMNDYNRRLKKCERDFNKIRLAQSGVTEADGFIIALNPEYSRVTVHLTESKIMYDVKLVEPKLSHLYGEKLLCFYRISF